MAKSSKPKTTKPAASRPAGAPRRCGLCGKTTRLTKTGCCGRWICDDEDDYVLFSYAQNSCHRNHDRYTLCARHHAEGHDGAWQDCHQCRAAFATEMYVYYGTNAHNFEKLRDPPAYEPTKCTACGTIIRLAEDGYSMSAGGYFCDSCTAKRLARRSPAGPVERG